MVSLFSAWVTKGQGKETKKVDAANCMTLEKDVLPEAGRRICAVPLGSPGNSVGTLTRGVNRDSNGFCQPTRYVFSIHTVPAPYKHKHEDTRLQQFFVDSYIRVSTTLATNVLRVVKNQYESWNNLFLSFFRAVQNEWRNEVSPPHTSHNAERTSIAIVLRYAVHA
jgi:hypothetical protein